jgi:MSHA biogenesis protein MshK
MKLTKQLNVSMLPLNLVVMICFSILLLLGMREAQADGLKDPTQPPASVLANSTSAGIQNTNTGPVLQSVMISTQFRAAIINGQKVMLGKKYEQATLISVDESQVVIRNPYKSTLVLKMGYADMKKSVSPAPIAKVRTKKIVKHTE